MFHDSEWPSQIEKCELKLNCENSMNDYLNETNNLTKNDFLDDKCFLDPNMVLKEEHIMVRNKEFSKIIPPFKEQIGTEAIKMIREDNYKKGINKKEDMTIKKEIVKLKQIMVSNRLLKNRKIENSGNVKSKYLMILPEFSIQSTKLWKRFEYYDCFCEVDIGLKKYLPLTMESKISSKGISFNLSAYSKMKDRCIADDFLYFTSCNCKESSSERETTLEENLAHRNSSEKKKLEEAWKVRRNFMLATKQWNKEQKVVENKIEEFLTRLQEKDARENSVRQKRPEKNIKSFNDLETVNQDFRVRMKAAMLSREKVQEGKRRITENDVKKDSILQEIIREVETSRKQSYKSVVALETLGNKERSKVLKILANVPENVKGTQKIFPIPKFLLRMEKRKEERNNRWKNIQERKRKLEEERENNRRQHEMEMKAVVQFAKQKKILELKQKIKINEEKRGKEKKKKDQLRCQITLAKSHYERTLLQSYGLTPWLYLKNLRNVQRLQALNFFRKRLMEQMFSKWKMFFRNQMERKEKIYTDFYYTRLQKNCFQVWIKIWEERIRQYQAAIDFYDLKITERIFIKWLNFTQKEQLNYSDNIEIADLHYTMKLKVKFLRQWKTHPEIQRLEIAKEERKRTWRQKVRQILPDYQPVKVSDNF